MQYNAPGSFENKFINSIYNIKCWLDLQFKKKQKENTLKYNKHISEQDSK